jgi:LPS export ABC transporter protein LptC
MEQFYTIKMKDIIFIFLMILSLSACENDIEEVNRLFDDSEVQQETMKEVEMLYSDSAIVGIKIKAPTLIRFLDKKEPRQEFPDGLEVDFFTPNGQVSSKLTAKFGLRYENKNEVIVRDSVVWESARNEILETEELIWDEDKEKLYTNKYVTIIRPDEIIFGYGFESNQDFSYSKINAIEGIIKVNDLTKELKE